MTVKVPSTLVLTARLSSGITSVVSIVYIVLSILGLIFYFNCDSGDLESITPADYFWATIYRTYLLNDECDQQVTVQNLTQSYTVFVLMSLTLAFSALNLVTAITLTSMINDKNMTQYLNVFVYSYIGCWVATLVVDVTLGTHLGMDITYLAKEMDNIEIHIPMLDTLRQGAFYLMAISLKGFAIHAIQLVLICLIIVYLYDYQDMSKKDEHSIHKVGAINAFDQPRRHDENWTSPDMYAMEPFPRGHLNNTFVDDNARLQPNDFYHNSSITFSMQQPIFCESKDVGYEVQKAALKRRGPGSFRRSDSWNHQGPSSMQAPPSTSTARPFSYLEEVRRPAPLKPVPAAAWPATRAPPAPWAAPAPRLPAPDYSPHSPRRLKSALKPNYM